MFEKFLVGFAGVALLGIGGFIYWDHENCPQRQRCNRGNSGCNTVAPCCMEQQAISTSNSTEVLEVMPREVNDSH
jgi:hypothetical protein